MERRKRLSTALYEAMVWAGAGGGAPLKRFELGAEGGVESCLSGSETGFDESLVDIVGGNRAMRMEAKILAVTRTPPPDGSTHWEHPKVGKAPGRGSHDRAPGVDAGAPPNGCTR